MNIISVERIDTVSVELTCQSPFELGPIRDYLGDGLRSTRKLQTLDRATWWVELTYVTEELADRAYQKAFQAKHPLNDEFLSPTIAGLSIQEPPQVENPPQPLGASTTADPQPGIQDQQSPKKEKYCRATVCFRVPYEWNYETTVRHFAQYGPIDFFHSIESGPTGPNGEAAYVGFIRYFDRVAARAAFDDNPQLGTTWPLLAMQKLGPAHGIRTSTCVLCKRYISPHAKKEHRRICLLLTRDERNQNLLQQPSISEVRTEAPVQLPAEAAAAHPEQSHFQEVPPPRTYIRPLRASGPLVGCRHDGYIFCYTHQQQIIPLVDEGQEVIPAEGNNLENQLKLVYGTETVGFL